MSSKANQVFVNDFHLIFGKHLEYCVM